MMPLCGPVCGLSFALISEKEGDCKNLITIALTVGIKFSVIEAEDRVIHISLSQRKGNLNLELQVYQHTEK